MQLLCAGLLAGPLVYMAYLATIAVVLAVLVGLAVWLVLRKVRAEDVPAALAGLSQVIGAMSCFTPWSKWRNVPPGSSEGPSGPEPGGPPATISITAGQLAVAPSAVQRQPATGLAVTNEGDAR